VTICRCMLCARNTQASRDSVVQIRKSVISPVAFFAAGAILYWLIKFLRVNAGCHQNGDCYLPSWGPYSFLEDLMTMWFLLSPFIAGVLCMRLLSARIK
jgi:hypothetical protein